MAHRLTADQAEHALAQLRTADRRGDDPVVRALLARLQETAGKRHTARVRKWFDAEASARDERRRSREQHGTLAEQHGDYQVYLHRLADELEAATRGHHVTREMRERQTRGGGMSLVQILASNPATIKKHLSEEAMQHLGEHGRPLSFDAWRYSLLGARDARAVESWAKRNAGYFGEWG